MEQATSNTAVAVTTEQNKVTQELLMDFLKQTLGNLPQNQQAQFLAVAKAFNLNPWKREIYAVRYGDKFNVIVGYETYLKRAEEFPQYDGYETEWRGEFVRGKSTKSGKNGNYSVDALVPKDGDVSCICRVFRKDRKVPVKCEVFFSEYDQGNSMWQSKPRVMLEKVAIATAMRRAFPSEFDGMPYIADELPDEMTGADKLNQQGYTEVPQSGTQEAKPKAKPKAKALSEEEKAANFAKSMDALIKQNEMVAADAFTAFGYDSYEDVPADKRQEVYFAVAKAVKEADNG